MIREYLKILKVMLMGLLYVVVFVLPPLMFVAAGFAQDGTMCLISGTITFLTYPALVITTERICK